MLLPVRLPQRDLSIDSFAPVPLVGVGSSAARDVLFLPNRNIKRR